MLQVKAGMHQPLERKGPDDSGMNQQKTQPEERGFPFGSHSGKYCSLIQDQARELTHLRQQMRTGRVVSSLLIQHVSNAVKIFEGILSSNNIDHSIEQHFREQLAKGSQLAESLASKLSTDDYTNKKNQAGQMPLTLREVHKKDNATEAPETRQDAGSQTQPHIHTSSTSSLLAEQEVHPAVGVTGARSATPSCPPGGTTAHRTSQLSRTPEPRQHGSSGPRTRPSENDCIWGSILLLLFVPAQFQTFRV
ncbi:myomegalin-like [Tamandua tetradactyla]|uniref:myomegalin-like n=1 Tax=Tamandua tetradactyla TaxID=48850 RepID=UPI0040540AD9